MSIEVHVRVRPGVSNPVWSSAETVLYSTANTNTRYIYNKVHPSNSSNLTIFQGIEAIVHAAFDGKNVTVMAYGQTGSGKTYSMIGTEHDQGIVPRTAKLLLELKKIHPGTLIQAYYTEIYNEGVKDLLEPQRGELALHDAPDGGVTFEKRMVQVESFEDFLRLQSTAERNRKYGVTNLNDHSSRSHIILTFEIHRAHRTQKSVINLVDLAGSESAARANTEGATLREGGFINRSLLTLGNVVDAIVEKRPYVPYRDAKLTRILRTCLGGTGLTFILCCVNPSRENYEQTITTLRFTQRAMKIKNDPVVVLNMPPLFVHQYAAGASQLATGLEESAEAEYQRGIRDAYMFCNNTAGSVVTNFQSQVADSMHALANAQRLLIAHDHALGMDRVGTLYNHVNELKRQRMEHVDMTSAEEKRQRDLAEDIAARKEKLARRESELAEKESAADTDVAGWEYQLHEARQRQVREVDLLLRTEETRRARIGYEWAVCVERIATRYVPSLMNTLAAAAALSASDDGVGSGASVGAAEGRQTEPVGRGTSKAVAAAELRERLDRARAELADLELAHEMVREDVEQARRANPNVDSPSTRATDTRGVSDAELSEQIALLEQEERQLRAQAKREIRRESLRRVRESLRRSSRSPQSGKLTNGGGSSRSLTPQAGPTSGETVRGRGGGGVGHGKKKGHALDERALFCDGDEEDEDNLADDSTYAEGEEDDIAVSSQRYRKPTSSSASRRVAATAGKGRARTGRSRSSSATTAATRDSYADGVRNALSVIDSLRNQLKLPPNAAGASSALPAPTGPLSPSPASSSAATHKGRKASTAARGYRTHTDPSEETPRDESEPTFLEIYGGGGGSHRRVGNPEEDDDIFNESGNGEEAKENYFGYQSRPGKSKRYAGAPSSSGAGQRPDVERTLHPLQSNSPSVSRQSPTRRRY